jgi:hypothetical protein
MTDWAVDPSAVVAIGIATGSFIFLVLRAARWVYSPYLV